jgi:hypothetical protein
MLIFVGHVEMAQGKFQNGCLACSIESVASYLHFRDK